MTVFLILNSEIILLYRKVIPQEFIIAVNDKTEMNTSFLIMYSFHE